MGEESEHEGERNASTIGRGAHARSAEGRASASTIGKGLMQGVRRGGHLPARSEKEHIQGSAEGRASASSIGDGGDVKRAKQTDEPMPPDQEELQKAQRWDSKYM